MSEESALEAELAEALAVVADAEALVGEQSDFSSVEGDVPDDIEDSWSSDTESGEEPAGKIGHVTLAGKIGHVT